MLQLAIFTFLLGAVYVAIGAEAQYPFLPPTKSEEPLRYPDSDAMGSITSNREPYLPKDDAGHKDKISSFFNIPSVFSKSRESLFSEWSTQICKKEPQLIEYFANNFIERVMTYKKCRRAFQARGFNAKSLSSFYNNLILEAHLSIGCQDPQGSAQVVSEAVADNFHKLKKFSLLRTYAESMAHILFYRGYLKSNNVVSLSQQYFAFTERSVDSVENPTPEAYIKAVSEAFAEFLSSQGLLNRYTSFMIAAAVASRWYAL